MVGGWKSQRARFLLSGLVFCGRCGGRYEGCHRLKGKRRADGSTVKTFYYGCSNYIRKGASACSFGAVRQDLLEERVIQEVLKAYAPYRGPEGKRTIRSLFKTYIRATTEALAPSKPFLRSVFTDNAGVVVFHPGQALCVKAETHNSPSALDPYGGAITGIVGVNRDPFGTGLGSDLLSNVWGYCFGPPDPAAPRAGR